MSAGHVAFEAHRAELVARAAAERETLSRRFAPLGKLESGLQRLPRSGPQPTIVAGIGLGLTALLIALPIGKLPLVRSGIAILHLAGSVRRLLSGR